MIDELVPLCYGRLMLTTKQIEESCICEINAMVLGWQQRYYDMSDLLITHVTLPIFQVNLGKKAPTYQDLTRGRYKQKHNTLDDESIEYLKWLASEE